MLYLIYDKENFYRNSISEFIYNSDFNIYLITYKFDFNSRGNPIIFLINDYDDVVLYLNLSVYENIILVLSNPFFVNRLKGNRLKSYFTLPELYFYLIKNNLN